MLIGVGTGNDRFGWRVQPVDATQDKITQSPPPSVNHQCGGSSPSGGANFIAHLITAVAVQFPTFPLPIYMEKDTARNHLFGIDKLTDARRNNPAWMATYDATTHFQDAKARILNSR